MANLATIELTGLTVETDIGTYGPDDVVPDAHILDLHLQIDPSLVLIPQDGMDYVFDYDPLVVEIGRLARDGHYHTQERLMTRIVDACATYPEIQSMEIKLAKTPVADGTGTLGVRIAVSAQELANRRMSPPA